jgi:hypothetical protein
MMHTLVAMFDNDGAARLAQRALMAAGFANAELYCEQGDAGGAQADPIAGLSVLALPLPDPQEMAKAAAILERHAPGGIDRTTAERLLALDPDDFA